MSSDSSPTIMTYEETVRRLADKSKHPLPQITTVSGKKITVALFHGGSPKAFCALLREQCACNTCVSRGKLFGRLSVPNKKGHPMPLFLISPKLLNEKEYTPLCMANGMLCTTPIIRLSILMGDYVGGYSEEQGVNPITKTPFRHYHIKIPEDKRSEVDAVEARLLEKAFLRYCPRLLPKILDTLLPRQGLASRDDKIATIKKALLITESALPEVIYGNRIAPSVRWLLRVVEYFEKEQRLPHERTPSQMWILCAQMLLWTQIQPDGTHSAVSPIIQQAHGNVIPLLDKATSKTAMMSMLGKRVDPRNYQRPTAAPTKGQVENAMTTLGEFSNRILTQQEAGDLPHAIRLLSSSSSMAAFQGMLPTTTISKRKNPGGFADRCDSQEKGGSISTVKKLLDSLRSFPGKKLEVRTRGMPDIYVASSTLDASKLCVPHLWAFTGTHGAGYFPDEWSEVAVVNPLYEYVEIYKSVMFVLKNVRPPKSIGNCCFPEFLTPEIRRTCRTAFEEINRRVPLIIDVKMPPAMGIGVSATNENGDLRTPLIVRFDGREHKISNL